MMKQVLLPLILFFSLFSDAWSQNLLSQWRGPGRDGTYPDKNLLTSWPDGGPRLIWKYDDLGSGYSSPAIASGRIFVTGTLDSITYAFCFDLKGSLLWKKALGQDFMGEYPGIYSTPVISGNRGYVVSSLGVLYSFSTENGEVSWKKDLIREFGGFRGNGGFLDNLIVDGEIVFCAPGGAGRNIVALNRMTGKPVWESKGDQVISGYSSPILIQTEDRKYYVYQDTSSIVALNASDGSLAWKYPHKNNSTVGTPIYRDGYLFTLDGTESVLLKVTDVKNPELTWTSPGFFPLQGDAILIGDRLYGKSKKNAIACLDWATGKEIASAPGKAMVITLISAEGLLYCYDIDGGFTLLKPGPNNLVPVGSFKITGGTKYHCSHPVIADGVLYVRHDNTLFAYDIAKKNKSDHEKDLAGPGGDSGCR